MAKRLSDNLNSLYVQASNGLRSKRMKRRVVAYVESYDDVLFWRNILSAYADDTLCFEVMLPSRESLSKGKKQAMMNQLGPQLGQQMIACVDADYDYLLQGLTATSRKLCQNPYVFHTYAYAIENYQCNAADLHEVCVMATLNDREFIDFRAFFRLYSQIVYPLFLWNVFFYRKNDSHTFPILELCNAIRLSNVDIDHVERALQSLQGRVQHRVDYFEEHYPDYVVEVEQLANTLLPLGVTPNNTYYFVQGHHLFENVTLKLLRPLCVRLRKEREDEIKTLAEHDCQRQNELSSYTHSITNVELMLKKNRVIHDCEPLERLKKDLEKFLKKVR